MHMLVHSLFPPPGMLGELTWLYWGPVGRVWGIPVCPGPGAITGGLGLRPWGPIPIPMPPPPPIIGWRGTLVVGSGGRKDCTSEIRLRTYHTHCTDGGIYAAHELEHSHNMGQNNSRVTVEHQLFGEKDFLCQETHNCTSWSVVQLPLIGSSRPTGGC